MGRDNRRFQARSGTYTCRFCGKTTRETGQSESEALLCKDCFERSGYENEHNDGHHDLKPHPYCPWCKEEESQ